MTNKSKLLALYCLLFSNLLQAKEVQLKWKAIEDARGYNLEVASDKEFRKVIVQQKVMEDSFKYDLKSGVYYLRVQALNGFSREGEWSKPFKLVVTAPVIAKVLDEKPVQTEKVSFSAARKSSVKTQWSPPEPAPKYLVTLKKDGKEVQKIETVSPEADFEPKDEGNYEIDVSSSLDDQYGPPVTIKKFKLEKAKDSGEFASRSSIHMKVEPDPEAKFYQIAIYKTTEEDVGANRNPASAADSKPYLTVRSLSSKFNMGKLPAGRYVATVTPVHTDSLINPSPENLGSISDYTFDVKKTKPVEFEKVDLTFKYSMRTVNYNEYITENSSSTNTAATGADVSIDGSMWLANSDWGLKIKGIISNLLLNNSLVSTSEIQAASQYRFHYLKFLAGARVWQMPMLVPNNNSNGSASTTYQNFTPSFLGPMLGVDYTLPLSKRWAINAQGSVSAPLSHSSFSSKYMQETPNFTINPKIELGFKYAFNGNIRFLAMAGASSDKFSYSTFNGNNNTTLTSASQSKVSVDSFLGTVGAEITDDGASFDGQRSIQHEKFSDLDFTARYSYMPTTYSAHIPENSSGSSGSSSSPTDVGFYSPSNGYEFDATGFFIGSHHGIKLSANWTSYSYLNTSLSIPEFEVKWAYRRSLSKNAKFNWRNLFGIRSWQLPIVLPEANQGTFTAENPQILSLAEGLEAHYGFAENWDAKLAAEISVPVLIANQGTEINAIYSNYISYKYEAAIIRKFSNDLAGGLSFGYKSDQLQYQAATVSNSSVTVTAPVITLFGTYSF